MVVSERCGKVFNERVVVGGIEGGSRGGGSGGRGGVWIWEVGVRRVVFVLLWVERIEDWEDWDLWGMCVMLAAVAWQNWEIEEKVVAVAVAVLLSRVWRLLLRLLLWLCMLL